MLSLATAGIALRLFNIKLPQLHARHIVDKTASRTSSAPAVEQLLSNDLFVGAPCLGCSNLLTQAASKKNSSQMLLPFSDHETRASLGFKQGQGRLKTALATQQDMPRHSDECGSVALYLFMNVNFDWHVLAYRRCSGFLATPAGSIVSADLVYRHGANWQEDAAKNAALRELREEAGLHLRSSVMGHFFTLAKDTTLINQKFQDRFGKVHESCMSLYVCSNYCKHCSSNAPAGRQAEKRKPHQFRLCLAVFLPRRTRGPRPSTQWQTRAPATRDLWWSGLTSKEGLHEHPVVVAKEPRLMRVKPPLAVVTPFGSKWLRSTWFLRNGSWLEVRVDLGCSVRGLMDGLNAQFGSFIPYRLLYRRGNDLHDHDQFTSGLGMLTCSPCWPHSLKNCQASA